MNKLYIDIKATDINYAPIRKTIRVKGWKLKQKKKNRKKKEGSNAES